jgi:hypothetical protein
MNVNIGTPALNRTYDLATYVNCLLRSRGLCGRIWDLDIFEIVLTNGVKRIPI